MKNFGKLLTMTLLSAAVFGCVSRAQERPILTATIPFDFTIENTNLPAGSYTLYVLAPFNMIKVQRTDGREAAMVRCLPSLGFAETAKGKLVFHRVGGEYFLAQAWDGSKTHREFHDGKRALELAKNRNRQKESMVAVVAQ